MNSLCREQSQPRKGPEVPAAVRQDRQSQAARGSIQASEQRAEKRQGEQVLPYPVQSSEQDSNNDDSSGWMHMLRKAREEKAPKDDLHSPVCVSSMAPCSNACM